MSLPTVLPLSLKLSLSSLLLPYLSCLGAALCSPWAVPLLHFRGLPPPRLMAPGCSWSLGQQRGQEKGEVVFSLSETLLPG